MVQFIRKMIWLSAAGAVIVAVAGCASTTSSSSSTARNSPRLQCGPGMVVMCETKKTGFGRLSTGRKSDYDRCSCEPSAVVIQDRPLPRH